MAEATTTLVSSETKSGSNQMGPWSFEIYTDAAGQKFQTDFNSVSYQSLLNQPVTVIYEEVQRGNFTNKVIKAVTPAGNQQSNGSSNGSQAVTAAPVAPQGVQNGDAVGKTKAIIAAQIAPSLFESLPADEQTFENAVQIMDRLVQYAFANTIAF